ncbi:MAG: toxin-antitoxin system HicB family antitoxin [Lentisphaerae bacterium]|nr:toxin-antitoxin system HicB family antitoxin [Lentisphaerota bacterium]
MSALNLRLPNSVHRHIRDISSQEGVSINQFILAAVSEKISAIMTEDYITERAKKAKSGAFKRILDRVPHRPPLPGDEIEP